MPFRLRPSEDEGPVFQNDEGDQTPRRAETGDGFGVAFPPGVGDFVAEDIEQRRANQGRLIHAVRYKTAYTRKRDFEAALADMTAEDLRQLRVTEYSPRGDGPTMTLGEAYERAQNRSQCLVAIGPRGDFYGGKGVWSRRVDPEELFADYDHEPAGPGL